LINFILNLNKKPTNHFFGYESEYSSIDETIALWKRQLSVVKKTLQLVVTIPARNEEKTIEDTLLALLQQQQNGKDLNTNCFEVMVLCNHCTDHTLERCLDFKKSHPDFPLYIFETKHPEINTVGATRRVLMDLAAKRLPENGFIVTTDADTLADRFWLHSILEYQNQPVDLVCGWIEADSSYLQETALTGLHTNRHYLQLMTQLECSLCPDLNDPWPRHYHHSGPNMAIRKKVYEKIGGIPRLACFEDVALYEKVISSGYRVRHSFKPVVTTSCRKNSRVKGGFGSQLQDWSVSKPEVAEGFLKLQQKFEAYGLLKEFYTTREPNLLKRVEEQLHLCPLSLQELTKTHAHSASLMRYLEQLLSGHRPWYTKYPNIPIAEALNELKHYFSSTIFSQH